MSAGRPSPRTSASATAAPPAEIQPLILSRLGATCRRYFAPGGAELTVSTVNPYPAASLLVLASPRPGRATTSPSATHEDNDTATTTARRTTARIATPSAGFGRAIEV